MNLIATKKIDKDETIYSWYVRNMKANGFDIKDINLLEFNKKVISQDLLLKSSLKSFTEIYPNDNPYNHTLQSFYKIFYKNGNAPQNCYFTETHIYCPESFKKGDMRIKLYDQIPLKRLSTEYKTPLYEIDNISEVTSNIDEMMKNSNQVIAEMDLEKELELSLMIEELYRERYSLNHMTLYGALIEEYARILKSKPIDEYTRSILEKISAYHTIENYPRDSTFGLLNFIYLNDLQVNYKLFILTLFLTFQTADNLKKAIIRTKSHPAFNEYQYKLLLKLIINRMKYQKKSEKKIIFDEKRDRYRISEEIYDEDFRNEVKKKYRGEYRVIREFNYHSIEYAEIEHDFCNLSSVYIKEEFLSGKNKCPFCNWKITEEMIEEKVRVQYEGRYSYINTNEISSLRDNNTGFILNNQNNEIYTIKKTSLVDSIKHNQNIIPDYVLPQSMILYQELITSINRRM